MALDSNGLELLNRQPEAHVSVDNMLVLIHWVSNLLTLAKNSRGRDADHLSGRSGETPPEEELRRWTKRRRRNGSISVGHTGSGMGSGGGSNSSSRRLVRIKWAILQDCALWLPERY